MRYLRIGLLMAFAAALLVVPNGVRVSADNDELRHRFGHQLAIV